MQTPKPSISADQAPRIVRKCYEFPKVFTDEKEAISYRRAAINAKLHPDHRDATVSTGKTPPDSPPNLTGLALSGGGIRSAAFCLGVLQAIDAQKEDHEPQILDRIDYLSTASGGGYIGTSLVSGLMQTKGKFPFASKLDQSETIEVQHLRDHSKYLVPNGARDYLIGGIAVLRGLIVNATIFLAIILLAAALTVFIHYW